MKEIFKLLPALPKKAGVGDGAHFSLMLGRSFLHLLRRKLIDSSFRETGQTQISESQLNFPVMS